MKKPPPSPKIHVRLKRQDGLEVDVRGTLDQVTVWLHQNAAAGEAAVKSTYVRCYWDGIVCLWDLDDPRLLSRIKSLLQQRKGYLKYQVVQLEKTHGR